VLAFHQGGNTNEPKEWRQEFGCPGRHGEVATDPAPEGSGDSALREDRQAPRSPWTKKVCSDSVENLNQILADTITLRDLYKKHHWQAAGHTFYQLHLLFDKHYEEQDELVDTIAERIQLLGGISLAMAADVAETTIIPRPPRGREGRRCRFRGC